MGDLISNNSAPVLSKHRLSVAVYIAFIPNHHFYRVPYEFVKLLNRLLHFI
jgi:hypothetical protein